MKTTDKEYDQMAKKASPPSPKFKNLAFAFLIGGFICLLGQVITWAGTKWGLSEVQVKALAPVTLIVITAILTGLGVFDNIARYAGAGTIVPITGFANAVVSPAMEFKAEGKIMGTGVQMFTIAGPVIVYGTGAAVLYGLIIYIFKLY